LADKYYQQGKPASFEQTSGDVDVSETVVLPVPDRKLKGDRLDFTRKWLDGDIKSWAAGQPKPDLILGGLEEEPDLDERSLGSCSAEVAAINSAVRKKKKTQNMPDLIQNAASEVWMRLVKVGLDFREVRSCLSLSVRFTPAWQFNTLAYHPTNAFNSPKTGKKRPGAHQMDRRKSSSGSSHFTAQPAVGPIKPQPMKPQALYPPFPCSSSSTSNLTNFNNFPRPFRDDNVWANSYDDLNGNCYPRQRISSHSREPLEKQNGDTLSWRSIPQDPYNTLGSVRSAEVRLSARNSGAFTPVQPPHIVAMRSSVSSLPESSIVRPQPLRIPDPALAIDALVAELELNTDQVPFESI
uniref:CUT domain-containing protein n=1 Tax=Gongylonema pulchrum TaxID=637853 RepID=A0A183EH34_9BILA